MNAVPSQRWPEPPHERRGELTDEHIQQRSEAVRRHWMRCNDQIEEKLRDGVEDIPADWLAHVMRHANDEQLGRVIRAAFDWRMKEKSEEYVEDEWHGDLPYRGNSNVPEIVP